MNDYIRQLKKWYALRNLREKLLCIGLCWALIYAIFSFIILIPLERKQELLIADIKVAENQVHDWKIQIEALQKIPSSPLYKKWLSEHREFDTKTKAYRSLLQSTASINWEDIVKFILQSDNNIIIEQIKNFPEERYNPPEMKIPVPVYQQRLLLVIQSNYFDTLAYLKRLQKTLPTIHWKSLSYHVEQYPVAKVEMEFLVLYEKTN